MTPNRRQAIGLACTAAAGFQQTQASEAVFPVTPRNPAAIDDAFAKCIAAGGGVVHFTAGEHPLDRPLNIDVPANVGLAIRGDGPGVSRIVWRGSADGIVLRLAPGSSGGAAIVEGLSLTTTRPAAGGALRLESRGGSGPHPLKRVRDVAISGPWTVGIDCLDCTFTNLENVDVEACGTAVRIAGDHDPVDNYIARLRVRSARTGIEVTGACEGVYVAQSTLIGVERGVHWHTAAGEPLLSLTGSHIAASHGCIIGHNLIQPLISGNQLYQAGHADEWAGIRLSADAPSIYDLLQVSHNTIHGFPGERAMTTAGITIAHRTGGVVQGNVVRDVQVGISLDEDTGGVRVLDNHFDRCTTADVSDRGNKNVVRKV